MGGEILEIVVINLEFANLINWDYFGNWACKVVIGLNGLGCTKIDLGKLVGSNWAQNHFRKVQL